MARKQKARKLTRRDAVALIGAGAVTAAMRPADAEALQPTKECDMDALVGTFGKPGRQAIASYSCCDETRNAILVGVEEPKRQATVRGKSHLRPLRNRLLVDRLEEYCFMIWGLSEDQAKTLFADVPKRMGFNPETRTSGK